METQIFTMTTLLSLIRQCFYTEQIDSKIILLAVEGKGKSLRVELFAQRHFRAEQTFALFCCIFATVHPENV